MSVFSQTRALLNRQVPPWLAVNVDRHFFTNLQSTLKPQPPPLSGGVAAGRGGSNLQSPHPKSPHWRRITQVYAILDRHLATANPVPSYTALIQHVQAETGTGCSRKLISKWKRDRGLR